MDPHSTLHARHLISERYCLCPATLQLPSFPILHLPTCIMTPAHPLTTTHRPTIWPCFFRSPDGKRQPSTPAPLQANLVSSGSATPFMPLIQPLPVVTQPTETNSPFISDDLRLVPLSTIGDSVPILKCLRHGD